MYFEVSKGLVLKAGFPNRVCTPEAGSSEHTSVEGESVPTIGKARPFC